VTNNALSSNFSSDGFVKRNKILHSKHLEKLDGPTGDHYSKTYGINKRSSLIDVNHFDLFEGGLPHDVMHDVFEGIAPLEIKLLLLWCINNKYFSLN
jgi:hypothetical protein